MATDASNSPRTPNTQTTKTTQTAQMDSHPDIVAMRDRYAAISAKPVAGLVEGLCLLTGLYLAISPWVVGFQSLAPLRMSNLITGIALAVLAMGFGSVLERTHGLGWVAIGIGVWTIIAPWVIAGHFDTHKTITNNAIVGGVACLLGLATMGMGLMRRRTAR
ncbi:MULTISPECIES: SPW repeat protein [unclassified Streptomyces]|uniref:SPW repeat protein n=1 Tax=unclassified Streptomyces TaxID=2593676 RepID=UPI002E2E2D8C|nr:SPW repeat protein [Streptomyces sp. NBC_00223]